MKIFGKKFETRKELKKIIVKLEADITAIKDECNAATFKLNATKLKLDEMKEDFPFVLGRAVYDVQLRNEKGRYAKKNVSLEHSIINEVIVDTKNYFNLVERYKRNDVFLSREDADVYLKEICTNKR